MSKAAGSQGFPAFLNPPNARGIFFHSVYRHYLSVIADDCFSSGFYWTLLAEKHLSLPHDLLPVFQISGSPCVEETSHYKFCDIPNFLPFLFQITFMNMHLAKSYTKR